jgi:hypothetical protein
MKLKSVGAIIIILLVVGVVYAVVSPTFSKRSVEQGIKDDLARLTRLVNLYMVDYDGRYPLSTIAIPEFKDECRGCNRYSPRPVEVQSERYALTNHLMYELLEQGTKLRFPFDAMHDSIVKAPFYQKTVAESTQTEYVGEGDYRVMTRKNQPFVLGTTLDGSVRWVPIFEEFELERAGKAFYALDLMRNYLKAERSARRKL